MMHKKTRDIIKLNKVSHKRASLRRMLAVAVIALLLGNTIFAASGTDVFAQTIQDDEKNLNSNEESVGGSAESIEDILEDPEDKALLPESDNELNYAPDSVVILLEDDFREKCEDTIDQLNDLSEAKEEELKSVANSANSIGEPEEIKSDIEKIDEAADAAKEILDKAEGESDELTSFAAAEVPEGSSVEEAIELYASIPGVISVEPDYLLYEEEVSVSEITAGVSEVFPGSEAETGTDAETALAAEATNDTYFNNQWYLKQIGAEKAWEYVNSHGGSEILIAVADCGVDVDHKELKDNVIRDKCRWTVEDNPSTNLPGDFSNVSHGTHVAGIIAGKSANGKGIAGIGNNKLKIASLNMSPYLGGSVSVSSAVRAVNQAQEIGARVFNISLGTGSQSRPATSNLPSLKTAMDNAYANGLIIVCSAGNDAYTGAHYPSDYDSTISVINCTGNNVKASSSNYSDKCFISAPGTNILSTLKNNNYGYLSGTSMASPVVTASIGLMLSVNPSLTPEQVKTILKETAYDTSPSGFDIYSGWGIIQTDRAVARAAGMGNVEGTGAIKGTTYDDSSKTIGLDGDGMNGTGNTADSGNGNGSGNGGGSGNGNNGSGGGNGNNGNDNNDIVDTSKFDNPTSAESFVERLYYYALGRQSDAKGLKYWTDILLNKEKNGGEVAFGFFFSEEFTNKNVGNEEYVNTLYKVFLGRNPDDAGRRDWMNKLNAGMSRLFVMDGFAGSPEFATICGNCGFASGTVPSSEQRDVNEGVTGFIARLYEKALGRSYDANGLNYWCEEFNSGRQDLYTIATNGFMHSQEFYNRGLNDSDFVKTMYRTFFDREYDGAGYNDWMGRLSAGASRDEVIAGFAGSQEFRNLMASYGL